MLLKAYLLLVGLGASGALAFAVDYFRMADLKRPVAKQLLILNVAIGLLLSLVLVRYLFRVPGDNVYYMVFVFILLAVVDCCIFYQWKIMRQIRKKSLLAKEELNG